MNIKQVIKNQGWTISAVAKEMNVTQSTLSQIIGGNPTIGRLQEIANIIGVSLSELVSDDNDKSSKSFVCPHCGKPINVTLS